MGGDNAGACIQLKCSGRGVATKSSRKLKCKYPHGACKLRVR